MDFLVTHHDKPSLLYYFLAAYLLHFQGTLSNIQNIDALYTFTHS